MTISDATKCALQSRKAMSQSTGQIPFGKTLDSSGLLIPVESEQVTIDAILNYRKSGMSLRDIAARLNSDGVPTKKGGKWIHTTIKRILYSKSCDGKWLPPNLVAKEILRMEAIHGPCPADLRVVLTSVFRSETGDYLYPPDNGTTLRSKFNKWKLRRLCQCGLVKRNQSAMCECEIRKKDKTDRQRIVNHHKWVLSELPELAEEMKINRQKAHREQSRQNRVARSRRVAKQVFSILKKKDIK